MRPLHHLLLALLTPLAATAPADANNNNNDNNNNGDAGPSTLITTTTTTATTRTATNSTLLPNPNWNNHPTVYQNPSSGYVYHGCFNETTGLPNTAGMRALHGGAHLVGAGTMTVETCWGFCGTGAGDSEGGRTGRYRFAGLEYGRECWCAQSLSGLSVPYPDMACDLPCDGNPAQACGGNLKLTVYRAGASAARVAWSAGLLAVGAVSLSFF